MIAAGPAIRPMPDWLRLLIRILAHAINRCRHACQFAGFSWRHGHHHGRVSAGSRRAGRTAWIHRHDLGNAADVMFYRNGQALNWANQADVPVYQDIVARARERGVTGFVP